MTDRHVEHLDCQLNQQVIALTHCAGVESGASTDTQSANDPSIRLPWYTDGVWELGLAVLAPVAVVLLAVAWALGLMARAAEAALDPQGRVNRQGGGPR